jgi:hypothetical protein
LQRFLFLRQDLTGAAVRGPLSPACCVLTEEDVCAIMEILVHRCTWTGVACRRNWSEASHVLAQLCDEVRWFHRVRSSFQ